MHRPQRWIDQVRGAARTTVVRIGITGLVASSALFAYATPAQAESGAIDPEIGESVEAFPVEPTPVDLAAEGLVSGEGATEWSPPEQPDDAAVEIQLDDADGNGAEMRELGPEAAEDLGIEGAVFELDAEGDVDIELDYGEFAERFGGGWQSRVRLVELPACALTDPEKAECRTMTELDAEQDADAATITATAEIDSDETAAPSVLALTADTEGETGDWSATDLEHSGSWSHGGSSGGFSYSYPFQLPPAEGPVPELGLSYSSQAVDGRTSSTNNQSGLFGDGWSFHPGFIERTYVSCASDGGGNTPAATADWCWKGESEAMTISLDGANGSLVKDDDTGKWHLTGDSGWKFELLGSPAVSGTSTSERWKVTATDGTQYYFGSRVGATASRLTAPVFGNHSGEACHKSGDFKGSMCRQAYRWLLDRVVDVNGNAVQYNWTAETGHYGAAADPENRKAFHRSSRLVSIVYGLRDGDSSIPGTGRVTFSYTDRCTTSCWNDGEPRAANWPETPWDLECDAAPCTGTYSKAFFTSKRLTGVTSYVRSGGTWSKVDSWAIEQRFIDYGDDEDTTMWLSSIQRTGHVDGTETSPKVTFEGEPMANRVEHSEGIPSMWRMRLTAITTETGSVIGVWYSEVDCEWGSLPSPQNNSRRCYPTLVDQGAGEDPLQEWFHKYVITQVTEFDTTGGQAPLRTYYDYSTDGGGTNQLWAWDDSEFGEDELRTYSQWRGYPQVTTRTGDPAGGSQLRERTRYYRGMNGQPSAADGSGSRSVSVTDAEGNAVTDHEALAGSEFETATFDGSRIIESSTTRFWTRKTATRTHDGGSLDAWMTGESRVDSRKLLDIASGTWQRTRTLTEYDDRGRPVAVSDLGDIAVGDDQRCTRTYYNDSAAAHLYEVTRREKVLAVACSQTPSMPGDLIGDTRYYYDGADSPTKAPTKGLLTATEVVSDYDGGTPTWSTTQASTYDALGRETSTTDALGNVTTTSYTPADRGPTTSSTTVNPLGHSTTVYMEPAWGQPVKTVDPNGRVTELDYDPFGRTESVWAPGWSRADHPDAPTASYEYHVSRTAPPAVVTYGLDPSGNRRLESVELSDSLLRTIQTQVPTPAGGRLISGVEYDTRGLILWHSGPNWVEDAEPGTDLVFVSQGADHSRTFYSYDGAGRVVLEEFMSHQEVRWSTGTRYGGSTNGWLVRVDPPEGGTPTGMLTDAHERMIEKRDYHGATATGSYDAMTYDYDRKGQLAEVHDPAGSVWTYEYDLLGNQIASHDPDTGTTRSEYDLAGQVLATTDADGRTVSVEYDELGREIAKWDGPAGTGEILARWRYDAVDGGLGLPYLAGAYVDGEVMITQVNAYDDAGRPTTVTQWVPSIEGLEEVAGSYRVSQSFLPDGSVSHVNVPAVGGLPSESIAYEYDELGGQTRLFGNLTGTPGPVDYVSSATYTAWGEIAQRVMGSQSGERVYETQTYEDGTRRASEYRLSRDAVGATNVAHLSYDFDPAGNLLSVADAVTDDPGVPERQCFAYDHLRRLTDAWTQPGTGACVETEALDSGDLGGPAPYWNSYTYDSTGNRTSVTTRGTDGSERTRDYAYEGEQAHLLSSVTGGSGTDTYDWDESGRLASRTTGGQTETFEWNAFGKLESITDAEGTTRMVYDADENRVARIDADGTASLFVAGHEITVDETGNVRAVRTYEHAGAVVATRSSDDGLTWIGRTYQGTAAWAIAASSMTVGYRRYDPFGNRRGGSVREWTATQTGYHTGIEDPTGLISMGARFYDPAVGRFISRDPVIDFRSSQQANGYLYAGNNPMTWTDSSGLNWFTDRWNKAKSWAGKKYSQAKSWASRTYTQAKNWVKRTVKKVVSAVVRTVRSIATSIGSWMYRKSPSVASWGGRVASNTNANGGRRTISYPPPTISGPWKRKPLWQVEYKIPSTAQQSKILGAGYAAVVKATGGSCSTSQGLNVCTEGGQALSARGGTTVGDTFTSSPSQLSARKSNGTYNDLVDHEKYHRDSQWRKYGVSFGVMYLWEESASQLLIFGLGKSNCTYNRYEFDAEKHGGHTGYNHC